MKLVCVEYKRFCLFIYELRSVYGRGISSLLIKVDQTVMALRCDAGKVMLGRDYHT